MAGHSKFKNIMHRKGAQDKKRAKIYTKILREVTVAAKSGADPDSNPRLRTAMKAAREANIPKDRLMNAISKGEGNDTSSNYEEIRYEGYAPGGIALIVDALTDNRNRTASEVRSSFTKFGGQLGETGSVNFMFKRVGSIVYPGDAATAEAFFEAALVAGANDCLSDEDMHEVITEPDSLSEVRDVLEQRFGTPQSANLTWKPNSLIKVEGEDAQKLIKLLDVLEDCDDVQNIVGNFEIVEE
jgi:YebC/PmpR family DNA-binding regulatory protein